MLLPITGRRSYILCTESCTEFVTLYEFNEKGNISLEHVSLGWLIQSSLEEKVCHFKAL